MGQYTNAVGTKFYENGSLRPFPGNTVICKTEGIEPLSTELLWAQNQYKQLSCAHKLSFLPPASFHMTVFDLVCDQVRDKEHWSSLIPLDMPLTEVDETLRAAVAKVAPPESFVMKIDQPHLGVALVIRLRPATAENEALIRGYRDRLSAATGVRAANHDKYRFHISLAYSLMTLDDEENAEFAAVNAQITERLRANVGTFRLRNPEFVLFNDMGDFQSTLPRL